MIYNSEIESLSGTKMNAQGQGVRSMMIVPYNVHNVMEGLHFSKFSAPLRVVCC